MNRVTASFLKKFYKLPLSIPFFVTIVAIYGFVVLYSAAGGNISPWAYKQILVFAIFFPIAILISMVEIRLIFHLSYLIYFLVLLMLILVQFAGKKAMGATRWIDLGIFHLQPSELAKIAIVLMLAKYFHNHQENLSFPKIILAMIAVIIPIGLIIKQPDLGTGIITILVATVMLFAIGVRIIYFVIAGISTCLFMPIIWYLIHDYQRRRILNFLDPERDPLGSGYNIIQSKIAIGSGGFFGKGLFSGTQSHLSFLPEYQTDFIFSFLAEELGFIGGFVLLALYGIIIVNSLSIAVNCRTNFARLMTIGITSIFFLHVVINIAMVMGMLPVVGVPLPLVSYGGTMMASMLIGFGLIMNANVNQHSNV